MRPADETEQAIRQKLSFTAGAKMRDRIWRDTLAAQEESKKTKTALYAPSVRRIVMKSPITKLAAAAVILTAAALVVRHLGGNGTSVAWGDVVKKLEGIQTFRYRERNIETSSARNEGFTFVSEREQIVRCSKQWGRRTDSYHNGELALSFIMNLSQETNTTLFYGMKRYAVRPVLAVEHWQRDDPHRMVIHCIRKADAIHELGTEVIEDITCEGIEIRDPNVFTWSPEIPEEFAMRIWVDAATKLPVWIEKEFRMPGRSSRILRIMDQFEWNVPLDPGLFEPNVPSHYALMESDADRRKPVKSVEPVGADQVDILDVNGINLLGVKRMEPGQSVHLSDMKEICNTQDRIVATWPGYDRVRDKLALELSEKLGINDLSQEQVKATAVALRERFWKEGGCLSETSYPYVYAARLLLEDLHQQTPNDLAVTDELVETLQSAEFIFSYDRDTDELHRNTALLQRLTELRSLQFEQIQRERDSGRAVDWCDFVRVNDLAFLYSKVDFDMALIAAQWLLDNAEAGGWTAYLQPLKDMHEHFTQGQRSGFNIYAHTNTSYPEEFRYSRRMSSFKGPAGRGAMPIHQLNDNPVWHSK